MGERRGSKRGGLAFAVALVMMLSGCSLVGDGRQVWDILQEESEQKDALTAAVDELRALEGVESAHTRFRADGPGGDEAGITVVAKQGTATPQLAAITAVAHEVLAGEKLVAAVPLFTLEIEGSGTFTQQAFGLSEDQLATEITYWRAAEDAVGAGLSLTLVENGAEPEYRREFRTPEDGDGQHLIDQFIANYAELQRVPDRSTAPGWWLLPGLGIQQELPNAGLVSLLDRIRSVIPLRDLTRIPVSPPMDYEFPEGALVSWNQWQPDTPESPRVDVVQNEYRQSDWTSVLEAAAITATVPHASFSYHANDVNGERDFRFFTRPCEGFIDVKEDDGTLVEALAQAGTTLPPGGGPGACSPTPPA
ncbi:MAG: hypothetical protein WED09_12030 [Homoserinimonas sp.]